MPTSHEQYLNQAIEMALENVRSGRGGPFGSLVVKDGRVVGKGTNLVTETNDPTAHAEVNAIREACRTLGTFHLEGAILYASCEPCPMCLGAIHWARIDRAYFAAKREDAADAGFDDAAIYREFICAPSERSIQIDHLLLERAAVPFSEWKSRIDRIDY